MRPATFSALLAACGSLVAAAPSAGCSSNIQSPPLLKRITTELSNNSNRSYMYWLPLAYDQSTPAPVIISYHGVGQSPKKQANLDLFGDPFYNPDHIIIWPQAIIPPGQDKVMFQGPRTATEDDITFTMDVMDEIEANLCIDTDRYYATGKSEGGGFAAMLACNATSSARFAAFAPVSGAFYPGNNDEADNNCTVPVPIPCQPDRCNIPFLEFHGGNDDLAPIEGGLHRHECLPNIKNYMSEWAVRNGLSAEPIVTHDLTFAAQVYKYDEAGTVTWVYDGDLVGHDWPWTFINPDSVRGLDLPATFDATPMMLDWFRNFTLTTTNGCINTDSKP